mmetsp:Transcript_32501/g.45073  ORF Transcript_32501/g.45073 Transcript_32501/m.45073 type:complete len:145 (-) Transcript_32501:139-573(-)|eukprot:CAMPEP_0196573064 /NCGR_PEP_ID=MMETSP1081-20130531/3027_1 /TAXON_ID=36882 /ORGANISM="Pyramimonas amylifera, Strain CCMP720" /LENGTH=144 /DNA_ID=CAMNT_0041890635 /DNA_START=106 /DNA_END=540 /DNA_ORIENTATION=-
MPSIDIKPEFGYVIGVGIASVFVLTWKGISVGMARKKYGVKYPNMYADKKENKDADAFNCVQRAHQNSLENYPQFLMLLFLAGMRYPLTAAGAGVVYLLGRIAYGLGYMSGDPSKRMRGGFGYFGLITLLVASGKFAYELVTSA